MHFADPAFLLAFLPAVWVLFRLAVHVDRSPTLVLLVASAAFYGWERPDHLLLLAGSIVVNHRLARRLQEGTSRRWLVAGVTGNLLLLGVFKYARFAANSLGMPVDVPRVVLPLGLSFFTFQQIGFLVDSARGHAQPVKLRDHALFVAFFPQLIAGPIVHHSAFHDQLRTPWRDRLSPRHTGMGLALICLGLFKKTVVADRIAPLIDPLFRASSTGLIDAWTAALGYTLQLFYDFGGYADLALGIGLLVGLQLPPNFDAPYRATTLRAFWRRWHITLGAFLRAYLYVPLGGRRATLNREWAALLVTFALGGLWHGAAWTFVWWGLLHGAGMALDAWLRRRRWALPTALSWTATFATVVFGWVLFRSATVARAMDLWAAMLGGQGLGNTDHLRHLAVLVGLLMATLALPVSWRWVRTSMDRTPRWSALVCAAAGLAGLLHATQTVAFVYYRF